MAASRTCFVFTLQGLLVVVNIAVAIGLTLDMGLTRLEITTALGQPANLGCYANQTNVTSLTYSWTKDNLTVTQSSNVRVHGNVLVVTPKKSTDFGTYECHVSNGVTNTRCNISLLPGCNNTEHEENPQGLGVANISVLMPVLAIAVVSLLLNIHFLIKWKRRDQWVFSEEEIIQLQGLQGLQVPPEPFDEKTEEHIEIKKRKPFFGRFRRKRRREINEADQQFEENDLNHQETSSCDGDEHEKHKQEAIEMQDMHDIPRVADIKTADETAPASSETDRRPGGVETPSIADLFGDETTPATLDRDRRPGVVETPRTADFFGDETAPTSSDIDRRPAVLETPRIADFFADETAPASSDIDRRSGVAETPRIADFFSDETAPATLDTDRRPAAAETPRIADFFGDETAPATLDTDRRPAATETPSIADFFGDETAPATLDTDRRPAAAETPRIADFFVPGDDTDGEGSRRESMNSEEPLVSHYVEKMDFEGKGDSDDEPVLK